MATFTYTAIDSNGKQVKGTVAADNQDAAISQVKQLGVTPVNVARGSAMNAEISLNFLEKKPEARDLSVFCRQMVSILNAGVGMKDALEMLSKQTENKMLKKAIVGCKEGVESGATLSESMEKYPKVFPHTFATMIAAGEASGSLDVSFTRIAEQNEKSAELKGLIKKSTSYPKMLILIVVAVVIFMVTYLVPKFEDFLGSLDTELPALTKAISNISKFVKGHIVLIAIIGIGLYVGFKWFSKTDLGRHVIGKVMLKIPMLADLTVKSASATTLRTLGTLLSTGINMVDALDIVKETMTNVYFEEAIAKVKDDVSLGVPLSEAMAATGIFPDMVCHMAQIGEETGNLVEMFDTSANYYEQEVEDSTAAVTSALTPLITVVMAGVVGVIIIALLMPMMTMYSALDNA